MKNFWKWTVWVSAVMAMLATLLGTAVSAAPHQPPADCDEVRVDSAPGAPRSIRTASVAGNYALESSTEAASGVSFTVVGSDAVAQVSVIDDRGQVRDFTFGVSGGEVQVVYPSWDAGIPDGEYYLTQPNRHVLEVEGWSPESGRCYRVDVLSKSVPKYDITEVENEWTPTWTVNDGIDCGPGHACTGTGTYSTRIPLSLGAFDDVDRLTVEVPNLGDVFVDARPIDGDCHTYLAPDPFSTTGQSRHTMTGKVTMKVAGGVNSRSAGPADLTNVPVRANARFEEGQLDVDFGADGAAHTASWDCERLERVSFEIGEDTIYDATKTAYNGIFGMGGYWITLTYELSFHKETTNVPFEDQPACIDEFTFFQPNPNGGPGAFPTNEVCGELPPGFGPDDLPELPTFPVPEPEPFPGPGPVINPGF